MQIGTKVIENADFLRQLVGPPRVARALIKNATNEQLLMLIECCYNLLRSRIPLTLEQRRRLQRHSAAIRQLARLRSPRTARQLLMGGGKNQTGRGFVTTAAVISSILLPLIHEYIYKNG